MTRLRVGQEAYQLSGVAESLDDYYTGTGEVAGQWIGGGAHELALCGTVAADDLRAVLAGIAPDRGGLTPNGTQPRPHPRRAPGFDLTFKAPKSASVLYAVSDDPRVQAAIVEAGEVAVREAIGWLEREVVRVRRGSHNKAWLAANADIPNAGPRQLETTGVIAASFRHRTSRAGDPLLHWHCLVANMAKGTDGKWSAIVHPELFRNAKTAGQIFQATFRAELTASLGVEWAPGRHVHEIAGIPRRILDVFSKRSDQIDAWLAANGKPNTAEARQEAALATRRAKPEVEHERLDARWKAEAIDAGWCPDDAELLIASCARFTPVDYNQAWRLDTVVFDEYGVPEHVERLVDPDEWIVHVTRTLTADRTTFTRHDLTGAVAAQLGPGASTWTIERIVNRCIASEHLLAVDRHGPITTWTTREIADVEGRYLRALAASAPTAPPSIDEVETAIAARPTLGADQADAVRAVTTSTDAVAVLIGPAGTGKTFTLDTIREAFEQAGERVVGAAPSARAAIELEAGARIPSRTLHSLLRQWDTGHDQPGKGSVLVIDEAGMADIRTLEQAVTRQIAAGGRVVLVGDHHQLPEVGAGGGFAYAAAHASTVATLHVNRRQRAEWEQHALTELRNGHVPSAVDAYLTNDCVVVTDDSTDMVDTAVTRYLDALERGERPVLLAGTNELVDRLNTAVIERLIERGALAPDTSADYGPTSLRPGERVVIRHNTTQTTTDGRTVSIANGQPGTITAVDAGTVTVNLDSRDNVRLDQRYLRQGGHISHGYALTAHRAQGGTWDVAISVGVEGLYREAAYVALSRGIHDNTIIITDPELEQLRREGRTDVERHDIGIDPDPSPEAAEDLIGRISRSRGKQLAHTIDPDAAHVDGLSRTFPLVELERRALRCLAVEQDATALVGASGEQLARRIANTRHVAEHIAIGVAVSPHDRHNVGIVTAIDDTTGTAEVHFVSGAGREAERRFGWDELRLVDDFPARRHLTAEARSACDDLVHLFQDRLHTWHAHLDVNGVHQGDAHRYRTAAAALIDRSTAALIAQSPDWLHQLAGECPRDVPGATTWRTLITEIATYRLHHGLTEAAVGIGPRPTHGAEVWDELNTNLGRTKLWLATTDRLEPAQPILPSRRELHERRQELDALLETAPPDCRRLIGRLRDGGLSLDDTADLLEQAHAQQSQRQQWIIRNWPHVVEYQEINRALATGAWGPDVAQPVAGRKSPAALALDERGGTPVQSAVDVDHDVPPTRRPRELLADPRTPGNDWGLEL